MAGEIEAAAEAIVAGIAAALPARVVGRGFKPLAQRSKEELLAGCFSLLLLGDGDYGATLGRFADPGKVDAALIFQCQSATDDPLAVERAELVAADEVRAFVAGFSAPGVVGGLALRRVKYSGQLECPFGWMVADLEVLL